MVKLFLILAVASTAVLSSHVAAERQTYGMLGGPMLANHFAKTKAMLQGLTSTVSALIVSMPPVNVNTNPSSINSNNVMSPPGVSVNNQVTSPSVSVNNQLSPPSVNVNNQLNPPSANVNNAVTSPSIR